MVPAKSTTLLRFPTRALRLLLLAAPALGLGLSQVSCSCGAAESPVVVFDSDVDSCRARLKNIYDAMRAMKDEQKVVPSAPGVGFFAQLISEGQWEDIPETRALLSCPGVNVPAIDFSTSFADLDALTGTHSAYAGRDTVNHPLAAFPTRGTEPLMACDNAAGMNHDGVMNVLYADGSIKTYVVEQEREKGTLGPEESIFWIGPNAQLEDLRKLTLD